MARMYETVEKELAANAKKAQNYGYWFCNNWNGSWLTPEEYVNEGEADLIVHGRDHRRVILDYTMRDPRAEITGRMRALNNDTAKLQEFTKKVFNYFNISKKDE